MLEENRRLRHVGEGVRGELMLVQQQLRDIQSAATLSVQQMRRGGGDGNGSGNGGVTKGEQLELGREEGGGEGIEREELSLPPAEPSTPPAPDNQDWTLHYLPLLPPQPNPHLTDNLTTTLRGVRWGEVEGRLWENIYSRYLHTTPTSTAAPNSIPASTSSLVATSSSPTTPLMSLTTFLKFCKEFLILEKSGSEKKTTEQSCGAPFVLDEEFRKVSYAELNLLFMSCARIPTSDVPKKAEVFKVSQSVVHAPSTHIPSHTSAHIPSHPPHALVSHTVHGVPSTMHVSHKKGGKHQHSHTLASTQPLPQSAHTSSHASFHTNIFYLTYHQFLHVLSKMCMCMFKHIVRQVVHTPIDNLTPHEQGKIARMATELALVKVFIPMAINLGKCFTVMFLVSK